MIGPHASIYDKILALPEAAIKAEARRSPKKMAPGGED